MPVSDDSTTVQRMGRRLDDVIDNMKRLLDELAPRNVMMVNAPTQDVNVIENMKSVLSYLEGQQGKIRKCSM